MSDGVRFVDGPAGRIAYRRRGAGQPVVLLHPLALSGQVWDPVVDELTGRYDVIAPDARGHGESGWNRGEFGVAELAEDVVALLDGLGLRTAHLIGMSMGGSVALTAAGRYPDRVTRLALADTTAWYGENAPVTWGERAERVLTTSRAAQIPFQVDRWFTEHFRRTQPEAVNRVVGIFLATNSAAHAQACRALGALDSRELLPSITAPTLAIAGVEDYATPPAMASHIADNVPNGTALTLPGLRHLSMIERPTLAKLVCAHFEGEQLPSEFPAASCGCSGQEVRR